jgi:triacylglycerol lipase
MLPKVRVPIVLVHGMFGADEFRLGSWARWDYFLGIPEAMRRAGNEVYVARLSPTDGIRQRAEQLRGFIQRVLPDAPLHLIGHSMGGLDARYLISKMDVGQRVLSLTTLGTPHRGCSFADWALRRLVRLVSPLFQQFGVPIQGFRDVTTQSMARFNEEIIDRPGVRYFSVAGQWHWHWTNPNWHLSFPVVSRLEGENDGLVSVQSSRWGESFEIWPGDHMNLVNWPEPFVSSTGKDKLPQYAALLERIRDL